MRLTFRFFEKEDWSFYGTINVLIPLFLFIIFRQKLDTESLIFMSLLGMMDGDLLPKIIFTGFLCFLVYKPNKQWIYKSIILIISVFLMNMVKYNNFFHNFVMKNNLIKNLFRLIILIWMLYIIYKIFFPIKKWVVM